MRAKWALAKVNFHTQAPSGEQRLSISASQGCHFTHHYSSHSIRYTSEKLPGSQINLEDLYNKDPHCRTVPHSVVMECFVVCLMCATIALSYQCNAYRSEPQEHSNETMSPSPVQQHHKLKPLSEHIARQY